MCSPVDGVRSAAKGWIGRRRASPLRGIEERFGQGKPCPYEKGRAMLFNLHRLFRSVSKARSGAAPGLTEVTRYGSTPLAEVDGRAPFGGGPARPGAVPIRILKKMRTDAQIALGLSAVKAPVTGVTWWAVSKDEEAARFIEAALAPVWSQVMKTSLAAVDFGFQAAEKVFDIRRVEYEFGGRRRSHRGVVYRKLRDLDPEEVTIAADERGDFAGLRVGPDFLPPEKCFVMTLSREWGNLYGAGRLEAAYEPWYWASVMYLFANRYFERKGDPAVIGRAPAEERTDAEGNRVRTLDEAARVISSLRSGGTAVFPDERDEFGNSRWAFEYLVDDKRADMFISYIEHLQVMKLRAILVPERTVTQDAGSGSYAMASEHTETFLRNEETLLSEIVEHVNRYIVRPLVEFNFGPGVDVRIETGGVRRKNEALLAEILFKVMDAEVASAGPRRAGSSPASSGTAAGDSAGPSNSLRARTAEIIDTVKLLEQLNVAHG